MTALHVPSAAVAIAAQCGVAVLVWGEPGAGKTASIADIARALGRLHVPVQLSTYEPADLQGPWVVVGEGEARRCPPRFARLVRSSVAAGRPVIVNLDEFSCCAPAVQAGALRLIDERVSGDDTVLGSAVEVAMVAAANPADLAAGGWEQSPATANRYCHIQWQEVELDSFCVSFVTRKWPSAEVPRLPDNWADKLFEARSLVAAFLHQHPALRSKLPQSQEARGSAWPSPRTWDRAATCIAACLSLGWGVEHDVTSTLVAGCVGEGAAVTFVAWSKDQVHVDPAWALDHPTEVEWPDREDRCYAILLAVKAYALTREPAAKACVAGLRVCCSCAAKTGATDLASIAAIDLAEVVFNAKLAPPAELASLLPTIQASNLKALRAAAKGRS